MKYRVHYPLITQNAHRDFATKADADAFAEAMRNNPARWRMHRHVRVEELAQRVPTMEEALAMTLPKKEDDR